MDSVVSSKDASDEPAGKLDPGELLQKVRQYRWFHSIDLGHGIVTPGIKSPDIHRAEHAAFFDPVDLPGRSVIDIGALDGSL